MNVFDYFFEKSKFLNKNFVLGNSKTISYKEIYDNSLILGSYLRKNVGTNKNIILLGKNSIFLITAYLSILKSGNVCIPLSFEIEKDNLDFIKKTTKATFIFCDEKLQSNYDFSDFDDIYDENSLNCILQSESGDVFTDPFDIEKTAEIIFTSGSTGTPKGVLISHKNIIANTNSIIQYLKLTSNDIICVVLPFYYCYGLSLLHTHLRIGGSIVLNNTFMFLGTVINDLYNHKCTGFSGVPSHFQILLKKSKTFKTLNFPCLRYVTQAGGKLHNIFIKEFVEAFPDIQFFVMYGQTEATARLSYMPPAMVLKKLGSIGKAIPDVKLKVIDSKGKNVPVGEIGEIVAKGDNIMQRYYKDPTGTQQTLKDGWLHTGDLATIDKEGFIFIVAREKEIIKVGGKRVSPKEIEEVILSIPEVIDCTIHGIPDDVLGESLKAVVVLEGNFEERKIKDKISKRCKEKLALYKIPQMFEFMLNMNVKSTGKK